MEFLNRIELRGFVGNVRKQKVSDRTVVSFSLATDYGKRLRGAVGRG